MPSGIHESIPATPEEVEVFADTLTEAYLHCRVWGHDPDPGTFSLAKDVVGKPDAFWDIPLLCTHGCGVRWRVLATFDGEVLRRSLDYSGAPGYICESGRIDKTGKMVLRKTYFISKAPRGTLTKAQKKRRAL